MEKPEKTLKRTKTLENQYRNTKPALPIYNRTVTNWGVTTHAQTPPRGVAEFKKILIMLLFCKHSLRSKSFYGNRNTITTPLGKRT